MKWIVIAFAIAYAAALALLAVGTLGLFGQERDPLSGIFLLPLGLPWNLLAQRLLPDGNALVAALAPLVNLGLLIGLWRWRS